MNGNLLLLIGGFILILAALTAIAVIVVKYIRTAGKKYNADYGKQKQFYKGAKDKYRAGEKVRLYYDMIATDTNYTFYIDGKIINHGYDDKNGFVIEFTMPEHDIKIECTHKNTMVIEADSRSDA